MNMNGPNPVPATNLRSRGATSGGGNHAENVGGPSATVVEPKKSRAFLSVCPIHTSSFVCISFLMLCVKLS
jgi:hypothetical protein